MGSERETLEQFVHDFEYKSGQTIVDLARAIERRTAERCAALCFQRPHKDAVRAAIRKEFHLDGK